MPPESGKTKTIWLETERPEYPALDKNLECDVLVIGAGVTGLTCAYLLAKENKKVVVVESGRLMSGETQRTTAHLSDQIDDSYVEILRIYGEEKAKLIRESFTASINKIEEIVGAENIDCDFSRLDAYLFKADTTPNDYLEKELEAGLKAGLFNVAMIESLETIKGLPPALKYTNQAQIHVIKYLNGLCKTLDKLGVQIFQESRVEKVDNKGEHKERPQAVLKNKKIISAKDIIVATNGPIIDFSIQTKQVAYRTFAIGIRIAKGLVPPALYWDTEEMYHYVRLQPLENSDDDELLIVGGEDHRVGEANDAEDRFARLQKWAEEKFQIKGPVVYKWSGQVYEPTDALGFIGEDPELGKHIYVATGDSGMGINNGTIAGILLTDLICYRENPWAEVYSPARQTLKALGNYIGENIHSLSHYKENVLPGGTIKEEEIPFGEGGIIDVGGKKAAAYRHQSGELTKVSAYCTHMGGVVCWNSCESSWDCPVHGSRFEGTGEVIYGPADGNLEGVG